MQERGIDADHLRVRLGVHQAWMTVAGGAADATARARVLLVQHHCDRQVEGVVPQFRQIVAEFLQAWLVADGRVRVGSPRLRLGRVFTARSVHLVQALRFGVVGLHLIVGDRPGG